MIIILIVVVIIAYIVGVGLAMDVMKLAGAKKFWVILVGVFSWVSCIAMVLFFSSRTIYNSITEKQVKK